MAALALLADAVHTPPADAARDRVERAAGLLNAAHAEMAAAVGELLAHDAWQGFGIVSPEHWLTWKAGLTRSEARRFVRIARELPALPANAALFEEGRLSVAQVDAIVERTDPA